MPNCLTIEICEKIHDQNEVVQLNSLVLNIKYLLVSLKSAIPNN